VESGAEKTSKSLRLIWWIIFYVCIKTWLVLVIVMIYIKLFISPIPNPEISIKPLCVIAYYIMPFIESSTHFLIRFLLLILFPVA